MILWGRPTSVNVQKALWALDEMGLDYEHRLVGGKHGGLDQPPLTALTPSRLIPVLQDGATTVWESHAILRHLLRRHPGDPLDSGDPATVDSWLDFGATALQPAFIGLFYQKVRLTPEARDARTEAGHREALARALTVVGRGLADGRPYLAGSGFGIADIGLGSLLFRLNDIAPEIVAADPAVAAWHERLRQRPAFARHVATSYDDLRPSGSR